MTTMTDEQLAEIRKRLDATSGGHAIERYEATKIFSENAEWYVELLLAYVDELRAENEGLRARVEACAG